MPSSQNETSQLLTDAVVVSTVCFLLFTSCSHTEFLCCSWWVQTAVRYTSSKRHTSTEFQHVPQVEPKMSYSPLKRKAAVWFIVRSTLSSSLAVYKFLNIYSST